jgi:hypothetical protein
MMFTAQDVRKAASLVLSLVLLVLVYIHEIFKKKSILSRRFGANFHERMIFFIFHVCRLVPEQAIEQGIQLKKDLQCHLFAKNKPDNTKYHIIIIVMARTKQTAPQVHQRQGPKVAPWNNASTCAHS